MAIFEKFDIFVGDLAEQVHDFAAAGDQLSIALTTATPLRTDETILGPPAVAGGTEIVYTNLNNPAGEGSALARQPLINASTGVTGSNPSTFTYILEGRTGAASDLVLKATGGPVTTFRYVVHFNLATVAKIDPLIQWYDHGSDVNLAVDETFTIDYNPTLGFFSLQ